MTQTHNAFWDARLAADWTESGVGYRALGRGFNRWMYRVRREVFAREASRLGIGPDARILDVGSGIGRYLQWWREAGATDITGSDVSRAAVRQLRAGFGSSRIELLDITAGTDPFTPGTFDVVSCMDVLFHLTDDALYDAAVGNLAALLRPGGTLMFTENFLHRAQDRTEHQVNRTGAHITRVLAGHGLRVRRRVPMLVLMNAQVDAPWVWRKGWGGLLRAAGLTPPTSWLAGAALYPLERVLTRVCREGPTTELAVAQRVSGERRSAAPRGGPPA